MASDAELAEAVQVARRVARFFQDRGFDIVPVISGNGVQLHIALPPGNARMTAGEVKRLLKRIAAAFDSPGAAIDIAVSNAARLMRLPFTMNRKCEPRPGRPQRLARLAPELLEGHVGDIPDHLPRLPEPPNTTPQPAPRTPTRGRQADPVTRAIAWLAMLPPSIEHSGGAKACMAAARAACWRFNLGEELGYSVLAEHFNPRCVPPWSEYELRRKCKDAMNEATAPMPRGDLLVKGGGA